MKRVLSLIIVIVMLCGLLVVPASAADSGSISMDSASGSRGDTVTLNVNLDSNPGLVTMTIRVSYDTSVLQLIHVSDPGLLVGAQLNSSYGSPYTISWVDGATATNNTKTGTIATFTFKILDNAPLGDSTVSLQFMDAYDTDYQENSFSSSSGKITVTCKHSYGQWRDAGDGQHSRTCTLCSGKDSESHTWTSDENNHWHVCSGCGLKQDETAHEPGVEETTEAVETVAPTEPEATMPALPADEGDTQGSGFPVWIVIVAAILVIGGMIVFAVTKKKKD